MARTRRSLAGRTTVAEAKPTVERASRRLGFTLIELLVVVSIIALLLSILLPALKKARQQAKAVVCSAHLKGIASGSLTYASEDPNEQAIPAHAKFWQATWWVHQGVYAWGGKSGVGDGEGDGLWGRWSTAAGRGPSSRPLNKVLFKTVFRDYENEPGVQQVNWLRDTRLDLAVVRCPSDRGYVGVHHNTWKQSGLTSYDHYGTSYAANSYMLGCAARSLCFTPFLHSLSTIHNATATVYYEDNCARYAFLGKPTTGMRCGFFTSIDYLANKTVKGWHGRPFHFVTAFVDGHVAMVRIKDRTWPPPRMPFYPDPGIFASCVRYDCLVIRGVGWQLDVLPTPVVWTGHPTTGDEGVRLE